MPVRPRGPAHACECAATSQTSGAQCFLQNTHHSAVLHSKIWYFIVSGVMFNTDVRYSSCLVQQQARNGVSVMRELAAKGLHLNATQRAR